MKAEIINGSLVLFPQSETEAFALGCWFDKNTVKLASIDPLTLERERLRGGCVKMDMSLIRLEP